MANDKKSLTSAAKSNPTALGDPVSLKAEQSDTSPTQDDQPNKKETRDQNDSGKKSLKDVANEDLNEAKKGNRSMLGDPVSLKAETTDEDPVEDDKMGNITGNKGRDSKL
ncbi:hypothetical protein A1O1_03841 [Capronia coronata CBS 617.96]|uniref:Uncharacterized protein n=1 Tax=Capronia coronata CBS 617.96 TaxID=1182541 RepID=W9YCX4_9EURO|nr:uncharacterized protein A1O1_03841 [Capronia coronata CBS 617.96]EXJ90737.1 hypothetical protein A1O1_03841 [Capronia coronata CBS 617.96]